jgi:hypothetical protein
MALNENPGMAAGAFLGQLFRSSLQRLAPDRATLHPGYACSNPSFRGARLRANPESRTVLRFLEDWIPGLRQEAHPGMTNTGNPAP